MEYRDIIQRVWSDWSIGEKLGEGSFGQVYFVQKERLGVVQKAAVKVVRIPKSDNEVGEIKAAYGLTEDQLKDFFYPEVIRYKEEIQLMQTLGENANIVQVQDFEIMEDPSGRLGWYILIRMELLESLDAFIKREKLYVGDVMNMAMDILEGIQECENHNIIHRDIKTSNLFRSKKGTYKLGDFGIARDTSASSRSLSHKGTDNYMAPEVYQGKRYSQNIDLYALGIVIYKLLNKNRLPFLGEERLTSRSIERAFQLRQQGEEFPKAAECSEEFHKIIKKLCAYNPEDRYQSAQEVLMDLKDYKTRNEKELHKALNLPRDPRARSIFLVEKQDNSGLKLSAINKESHPVIESSSKFHNKCEEETSHNYSRSSRSENEYEESLSRDSSYGDYTRQMYKKRDETPLIQENRTVQPNIMDVISDVRNSNVEVSGDRTTCDPYISYWKNYFNFKGRTSRGDYWKTVIINTFCSLLCTFLGPSFVVLWSVINFIPMNAMLVRRLRDAGFSPYYYVWCSIASVVIIVLANIYDIFALVGLIPMAIMFILLISPSKSR